eukprot:GHUV01028757.1.p1 GENE.GHUV01028757.1~~GHUV01028757.1.p1  ORF type:complete len:339 (+),score=67.78 GHUV01028757.1:166-1182(+)
MGQAAGMHRYGGILRSQLATLLQYSVSRDSTSLVHCVPECWLPPLYAGHGMLGELVAQHAGQVVVEDVCCRARKNGCNLLSQPLDRLESNLKAAFEKAHQACLSVYDDPPSSITYPYNSTATMRYTLYRPNGLPIYRPEVARNCMARPPACDRLLECGTTCTLAVTQGDQVALANVGDTAAALVSLSDDDVVAKFLTVDHNGRNEQEAQRIAKQHGKMARISEDRGYLSIFVGMWAGYELSVTRALGHKNLEAFGVLCEPAVTTFQLRPEDTCLIIASDGVWDVMDSREAANRVMDVVSGGGSAKEAAKQLVQDTVMLAECSPDGDADNTSAVVLVFE